MHFKNALNAFYNAFKMHVKQYNSDVEQNKYFFRDQNILVIRKKNSKKNIFFIIHTKTFTTPKILKMENKHPEHYWSA